MCRPISLVAKKPCKRNRTEKEKYVWSGMSCTFRRHSNCIYNPKCVTAPPQTKPSATVAQWTAFIEYSRLSMAFYTRGNKKSHKQIFNSPLECQCAMEALIKMWFIKCHGQDTRLLILILFTPQSGSAWNGPCLCLAYACFYRFYTFYIQISSFILNNRTVCLHQHIAAHCVCLCVCVRRFLLILEKIYGDEWKRHRHATGTYAACWSVLTIHRVAKYVYTWRTQFVYLIRSFTTHKLTTYVALLVRASAYASVCVYRPMWMACIVSHKYYSILAYIWVMLMLHAHVDCYI